MRYAALRHIYDDTIEAFIALDDSKVEEKNGLLWAMKDNHLMMTKFLKSSIYLHWIHSGNEAKLKFDALYLRFCGR